MKLKIKKSETSLPREGMHHAKIKQVKEKGEKRLTLAFDLTDEPDAEFVVCKDYAKNLDPGTELHKEITDIIGRALTGEDFELDTLLSLPCQVLVEHKRASGGKMAARVKAVLGSKTPAPLKEVAE